MRPSNFCNCMGPELKANQTIMLRAFRIAMNLTVAVAATMTAIGQPTQSLVQDEIVRREEALIILRMKLEQAEALKVEGELMKAALMYEEAVRQLELVGEIPQVEAERERTLAGMSSVRLKLAAINQRNNELVEADKQVVRVLKLNPNDGAALKFKEANDKLLAQNRGKAPSRETLSLMPEIAEAKIGASVLVQDAKLLLEANQLEKAEAKLLQAVKEDPENRAVWHYRSILAEKKYAREARKREIHSKVKMVEVEKAWSPPLQRHLLPEPNPYVRTNLIHTGSGRQRIQSKLNRIVLDQVLFDGLPLSEVVRFLYDEALKRDPDNEGINFLVNPNIDTQPPFTPLNIGPSTGFPAPALPAEDIDLYSVSININPPLRNVKLKHVVEAVARVADTQLKVSVEEYAVVFSKLVENPEPLYTRRYRVDPNTFIQGMEGVTGIFLDSLIQSTGGGGGGFGGGGGGFGGGGGGGASLPILGIDPTGLGGGAGGGLGGGGFGGGGGIGGGGQGGFNQFGAGGFSGVSRVTLMQDVQVLVRNFFAAAGVNFTPGQIIGGGQQGGVGLGGGGFGGGTAAGGFGDGLGVGGPNVSSKAVFFNDRTGILFVRATLTDLDIIEEAIAALNEAPPQLTIEAKFAEFTQDDGRALGFDWLLGNTLINGGKIAGQGGSAPSMNGQPSAANSTGLFPATGGAPTANPDVANDQLLSNGLRNFGPDGNVFPSVATFTGILTDPQFRVVIRALEQRAGIDILAAPVITTLSGRQATIKANDIQSIVVGNNANQQGGGGGGGIVGGTGAGVGGVGVGGSGVIGTTIQPQTVPIPVGPTLDLVPYVSADGYSIQMTILPSLIEFVGYDDPGPFAVVAQGGAGNTVGVSLTAQLPLPRLRVRQVVTSAIVWDGQTVFLGGLMAENVQKTKDKIPVLGDIPFLGRLFRSESSFTQKKNLAIFVTPKIIDPAGNRVHTEDNLPYDPSTVPPQEAPLN
ncbi:MAG: Type II secretion system protein D [Verrucomicrobia subdivision 3 bacterium]|nr:Type II secretion system protein D [Limisphaerales bacterium]